MKIEKKHWYIIIVIVFVFSAPSLFRISNIKDLYFSKEVQLNAVSASVALKNNYGIGATDTKLKKIDRNNSRHLFYFDYKYNHPNVKFNNKREYFVEFIDNKLNKISENTK